MSLPATSRDRATRPVIGLVLLLCAAAGFVAYRVWPQPGPVAVPPSGPVATTPPATAAAPGPSFDIVRVGPEGHAVVAGRAERGSEVTVRDGDTVLGSVTADRDGQFVLAPTASLPAGGRELTLSARGADGKDVSGTGSVVLVVPPARAAADAPGPVAVLLPRAAEPSRLLDAPGARDRKLALDTVDYDDAGALRFAGSAKPGASLRLYVDNQPVGDAVADGAGQWGLSPTAPLASGLHTLRLDQLGADGRVTSRLELPFQRTAVPPTGLADGRTVVQPGQNLWRIARASYGSGTRYTVIFLANRDRIRDPSRIYPGQVFAVPPRS